MSGHRKIANHYRKSPDLPLFGSIVLGVKNAVTWHPRCKRGRGWGDTTNPILTYQDIKNTP